MVERRGWLTIFSHVSLLLCIAVLALPIYVTFVASTTTRAFPSSPDSARRR